ncbi:hypothetical protein Q6A91_05000 [Aliarcobacter skirrowii]|uniref:hypothetical protein n=1 Tax=Aliarcobacter skirrowii TaxID=28200 RepID=UPI0029A8E492|nr:hypothetical protein [Aliarcobacter skirrowii]MDX4065376.1 hypothetical protein [Aliarcobacter skirrowii]
MFSRGIFTEEMDGFYSQMINLDFSSLDVLSVNHIIRYIVVFPFIYFLDFIQIQHFILVIYFIPLFFMKIPNNFKYLSILILYFSIFFSYRTILVMESILILIMYIKFKSARQKKYLFFSLILSLLSSGTFLIWLLILYFFRTNIIDNKRILKYLNMLILFLFIILLGPILHKILFFINPQLFGSATSVTIDNLLNISFDDLQILFKNIFERSMIYEAITNNDLLRLSIFFIMLILLSILLFVQKKKSVFIIFVLYFFSLFFEGLILYSLFFVTLVLFLDYLYRNLQRLVFCQKKY